MANIAKAMTEQEIQEATDYFTKLPSKPWIKVIETATVPKTRAQGGMLIPLEGAAAGTEPIGMRIIETPVDPEQTEKWRNSHSPFLAYAPPGSIKKGEILATTGGGKVTACTVCHGGDLRGLGPVPTLAGRSPSYLIRQLYDMQHGNRYGAWTPLMAAVVANLEMVDLVNVAAYLASLSP
jgi:cytochrome c553